MHRRDTNTINLTMPKIIGYMSVDGTRDYHGDLSQLKFLNSVSKGSVHLDLNHGMDKALKRSTDDNNEKINLLLKFLVDHAKDLNLCNSFVSYRRTLISIMCSAYHNEHVRVVGCLFNGSIYLCSLETPQEKQRRHARTRQEKIFCAWGYKFEQYMLSDACNVAPDIEKPVIENEEFSLFYHSTLGEHNLVYGAQIDALLATNNSVQNPPSSMDFQENLNYLKSNVFVELKTNRELQNNKQAQNFRRYKMLRCWCQCYLANLKGLLVGFRDDNGIVKRLQCYDTNEIVEYCKYEWQPGPAIQCLNLFLFKVKSCLMNHPNSNKSNQEPVTLMFDVHGSLSVKVSEPSKGQNDDVSWRIVLHVPTNVSYKELENSNLLEEVAWSLLPYFEDCLIVACGITNLISPALNKDKFVCLI